MSDVFNSSYNMRQLDTISRLESPVHRLHPLAKLLVTFAFLVCVVSYDKYEITGLIPFLIYPVVMIIFSNLPPGYIIKRILIVQPFIIGIGIFNPVFDKTVIAVIEYGMFGMYGDISITKGWITFISIIIKGVLTVSSSILLLAVTGMDKLGEALRAVKIPKIFVLQLMLTYRYISVLTGEVARMLRAHALRAPGKKGIRFGMWGSFTGHLLLRTYDRAQRVYQAMCVRGFNGEYHGGVLKKVKPEDVLFTLLWVLFFIVARVVNLPILLENLLLKGW